MKLRCLLFLLLASAASAAFVPYHPGTRALQDDLVLPSGKTLTLSGAVAGTPTGGTLNLSSLTLTLPAAFATDAEVAALLAGYQPLDADLTSFAALNSTGMLVYRSAAGTWTAVSIGAGLSFTGGTLANTGIATWGSISGTLSAQADLQNALNAKANAADGTHTGTTTIARADVTKVNVPPYDAGTIGSGGTLNLSNTYSVQRATFTGPTATIALQASPQPGVYRVDGHSTYAGGKLVITIPSLLRPEQDVDTPITELRIPATSGGDFTVWFYANTSFFKVAAIGDDITQRDLDAFHAGTANEFTALANKATPTTSDVIAGENAAAGFSKVNFTLGALPISTATQTALNAKANLAGGNSWSGTQTMETVQAPALQLAAQAAPSTPPTGYVYFYADSSKMPNVKDDTGAVTPLGIPPHIVVALSDETTDLTTGDARVTIRAPRALNLTGVRASLNTASTSGAVTVRIKESGTTIFSTNLTIDQDEKTSTTAATAAVISDTAIADDAELTFDIVGAGTGAKGLKVALYYR